MTSEQLVINIRALLLAKLAEQGLPDVRVLEAYQPTSQGREGTAIYFFEVNDNRYGWQGRRYTQPVDGETVGVRTEGQQMQTLMQFEAFAEKDFRLSAKDVLNVAAMVISSLGFIDDAQRLGIGVQRITDIRNPFFKNDKDRFEASPSFDVTFSYRRTVEQAQEFTTEVVSETHRVD